MGDISPSGASLCPCHHPWTWVCFALPLVVSSSEITQALGSGYAWGYAGENRIDPTALYLTGVCFAGF